MFTVVRLADERSALFAHSSPVSDNDVPNFEVNYAAFCSGVEELPTVNVDVRELVEYESDGSEYQRWHPEEVQIDRDTLFHRVTFEFETRDREIHIMSMGFFRSYILPKLKFE